MQYYAVTEIELMNFHIASILAGGKEEAKVVLDSIRKRKISYKNIEASNSADGKAGKVSLPEYREYNTTKSEIICQNIVEDMLNHLVREGLLTRSQCMSVRDTFVGIVVGKLTHVG